MMYYSLTYMGRKYSETYLFIFSWFQFSHWRLHWLAPDQRSKRPMMVLMVMKASKLSYKTTVNKPRTWDTTYGRWRARYSSLRIMWHNDIEVCRIDSRLTWSFLCCSEWINRCLMFLSNMLIPKLALMYSLTCERVNVTQRVWAYIKVQWECVLWEVLSLSRKVPFKKQSITE